MEDRVLVLAPRGRDAVIASQLLERGGVAAEVCSDLEELVAGLSAGAGAVMITEEALALGDREPLFRWVTEQPTWSDLPFVVLANGGREPRTALASRRMEQLGNVVLLERPLHADAMLGAVRSALKARRRQYEVRASAASLEEAVQERTRDLQAARDRLEIALEAAGMGSWDLDLVTGEAHRTLRHDEIFGYTELQPEWNVDVFLGHVDPKQRPAIAAAMEEALVSGFLDFECEIISAAGDSRWIVASGRVRYDDGGKPVQMTGVVSDVTERKLADAQLAQARKMDAVGQLTGGVAHDFNNLLTPIVGSLDMVRRRHKDDEHTQRMVRGALQAAERAATLTQRLLAFARRQALQPQSVDVSALIEGIVDLIRRSLGPTVEVVLDLPQGLPAARVDPNQLELALLNLAINARDAMAGGGRLTIAVSAQQVCAGMVADLAEGSYIRILAADTGAGMDSVTLARAVEPFFSTKGVGKGTGLGLSMVHGLAAQSGGTLQLKSKPGEGTSVELWLPVTEDAADNLSETHAEAAAARCSAKVLLVDDEELVRLATADMLRDIGYEVVEAASGSQALAELRSGEGFDILITDYLMPGMTGGALISELRGSGNRIPALLITGYAAAGSDVPADVPRLSKPFRQADLASRVNDLLKVGTKSAVVLRAVK